MLKTNTNLKLYQKGLYFLSLGGIGEIGAAILGPTQKGPSFVPTVVTSFSDFERIFGTYSTSYYTPYTIKEYLKSAGSVTVVRVGYLGGYKVDSINLVISGSGANKDVVATFLPALNNSSGAGSISGSLSGYALNASNPGTTWGQATTVSASSFTIALNGANATASVSSLSVFFFWYSAFPVELVTTSSGTAV